MEAHRSPSTDRQTTHGHGRRTMGCSTSKSLILQYRAITSDAVYPSGWPTCRPLPAHTCAHTRRYVSYTNGIRSRHALTGIHTYMHLAKTDRHGAGRWRHNPLSTSEQNVVLDGDRVHVAD
eukprot:28835-Eustigmatos_ZCMA.PRE.1